MIGLILFAFVARRYKYRERDDRPYDYYTVEDILINVTACDLDHQTMMIIKIISSYNHSHAISVQVIILYSSIVRSTFMYSVL